MAKKPEPEEVLSQDMHKKNMERFNSRGEEVLDPTPMQPPLGYKRTPSLAEQILQGVRAAKYDEYMSLEETEEEADDFEVEDMEPFSPHENENMPTLQALKREAARINEEIKAAALREAMPEKKEEPAPKAPAPSDTSLPPKSNFIPEA